MLKQTALGLSLDGGKLGEILLPRRDVKGRHDDGDELEVFLYLDSENHVSATTLSPYAIVGDFALLQAVSVTQFGAFLDWGLPKDLLVPFREQQHPIEEGEYYIVKIYIDKTNRIVASSCLNKFLQDQVDFEEGQKVLLLCEMDNGYGPPIVLTAPGLYRLKSELKPKVQAHGNLHRCPSSSEEAALMSRFVFG